ncbi:hypothetical protein ABSA28_01036 [Candidatus Hepatincolaceae symbiont of Richtersius coronifer]
MNNKPDKINKTTILKKIYQKIYVNKKTLLFLSTVFLAFHFIPVI